MWLSWRRRIWVGWGGVQEACQVNWDLNDKRNQWCQHLRVKQVDRLEDGRTIGMAGAQWVICFNSITYITYDYIHLCNYDMFFTLGMKHRHPGTTPYPSSYKHKEVLDSRVHNNDPHDLDVKHLTFVLVYFPVLIDLTSFLQLKTQRECIWLAREACRITMRGTRPNCLSSWGLWPQRESHKAFPDSLGHLHKVTRYSGISAAVVSCHQLYFTLNNSYFRICFFLLLSTYKRLFGRDSY